MTAIEPAISHLRPYKPSPLYESPMASSTASRILRSCSPFAAPTAPRQCLRITSPSRPPTSCPFSTTSSLHRDNNRRRGHSAIRAKGNPHRFKLISASKLPKPVLDREELNTPTTNHGLMGFFNKKGTLLSDPSDDAEHGRIIDTHLDKSLETDNCPQAGVGLWRNFR